MTVLLLKLHASHSVVARIVLARMVDLNKQKSLLFMELFLYLIFLDLDKMDIYRDNSVETLVKKRPQLVHPPFGRAKINKTKFQDFSRFRNPRRVG